MTKMVIFRGPYGLDWKPEFPYGLDWTLGPKRSKIHPSARSHKVSSKNVENRDRKTGKFGVPDSPDPEKSTFFDKNPCFFGIFGQKMGIFGVPTGWIGNPNFPTGWIGRSPEKVGKVTHPRFTTKFQAKMWKIATAKLGNLGFRTARTPKNRHFWSKIPIFRGFLAKNGIFVGSLRAGLETRISLRAGLDGHPKKWENHPSVVYSKVSSKNVENRDRKSVV